ncbi:MAG: cyclic-phosphate processing receiver domain-containing protein, partial [Candidatus Odinarchaeia archaeon]
ISFDHDLGYGPTGYDCVKWLVEASLDKRLVIPKTSTFYCHSANPVGKENILRLLNNYLNSEE